MDANQDPVVVGYDGSNDAGLALTLGADLARHEERPLRVVVARGDIYRLSGWADEWSRGIADESVDMARKVLAESGTEADVVTLDGGASEMLVAESGQAHTVVVGARGHNRFYSTFNGSVSEHVARYAACPVVVARPVADPTSRRVVVGVDGSEASTAALELALHHAGQRGLRLDVLYVAERWLPFAFEYPPMPVPELLPEFARRDREILQDVADVVARHPGVDVDVQQADGSAAHALIEASYVAQMVVVGASGAGAFEQLLLGSVSAAVLHRAHCPVAIVR